MIPQTATVGTILNIAKSVLEAIPDESYTFQNGVQSAMLRNKYAYKIQFPSNFYIDDSGDDVSELHAERFEYVAEMATTNSDLEAFCETSAFASFSFNLNWAAVTGESGYQNYARNIQLDYVGNR